MAFHLVDEPELTFADAVELVARVNAGGPGLEQIAWCSEEGLLAAYEAAERRVLSHVPQSGDEAAEMITVVLAQGGERVDGLDQTALKSARELLRTLMPPAAGGQAVSATGT